MLTQKVLDASVAVVNGFKSRGLALTTHDGSPLHNLNGAAISADTYMSATTSASQIQLGNMIHDSKAIGAQGGSEHCGIMSELVKSNGAVLTNLMGVVRNDLMPRTKEIIERYDGLMERAEIAISEPFAIVPNTYHRIWGLAQVHGIVERFKSEPFGDYTVGERFPAIENYDLLATVRTGIKSIDTVVEEWLGDMPADKLQNVWNKVFVNKTWSVGRQTGAYHLTERGMDRNDILMAFLIANGLEAAMPAGITISLDALRRTCAYVRAAAGRAVYAEVDRRETDNRRSTLIYQSQVVGDKYNTAGKRTVYVNNDVYQKFIEAGGSAEAIYGGILEGGKLDYTSLLGDVPKFEASYLRTLKLYRQRSKSIFINAQKESLKIAFTNYINSIKEDELPAGRSSVHAVAQHCISKVDATDLVDVCVLIRNLTSDVLFSDTNAKIFLKSMDVAEVENPGLPPREYALLAFIDLQARYVAGMIRSKKMIT